LAYIAYSRFNRTLIICPASAKSSWRKEIEKWTTISYFIIDAETKPKDIPKDKQILIINFDILKKFLQELLKIKFDGMIVDECHKCKNVTAIRTKATKMLARNIPHLVLLSGTPLLSRPIELFPLLNMIDPKKWSNYYDYARKYCNGHKGRFGYDASGVTNAEELHNEIKGYFIRRKKSDVLKDLPPKIYIDVPVEMSDEDREKYELIEDNLVRYLKMYAGKQPKEIAQTMQAQKLAQLGIIRKLIATSGLETAVDLIEGVVESGEKILVFSSYNEPLEKLQQIFGDKAVMITGKTATGDERGKIVDQFQDNPKVQVFLGGFMSAGEAITLTKASYVLKLDYPWGPGESQQAEDRAHRPSAVYDSLSIYQLHVNVPTTIKLKKILEHKQLISDQVIDGERFDAKGENIVKELIDDLMERKGGDWKPMNLTA
jgi:SWI/SNF-related matrix-associated actin-dependent regulator 1 of chromatin subfamily A